MWGDKFSLVVLQIFLSKVIKKIVEKILTHLTHCGRNLILKMCVSDLHHMVGLGTV